MVAWQCLGACDAYATASACVFPIRTSASIATTCCPHAAQQMHGANPNQRTVVSWFKLTSPSSPIMILCGLPPGAACTSCCHMPKVAGLVLVAWAGGVSSPRGMRSQLLHSKSAAMRCPSWDHTCVGGSCKWLGNRPNAKPCTAQFQVECWSQVEESIIHTQSQLTKL